MRLLIDHSNFLPLLYPLIPDDNRDTHIVVWLTTHIDYSRATQLADSLMPRPLQTVLAIRIVPTETTMRMRTP